MSSSLAPLWQISETLQALLESVATCPDDLKPELQAQIDNFLGKEAAKTDQVAHVLAALEYEARAADDEIARLEDRKNAAKAAKDRLEAYVCRVIQARGVKTLNGDTNTLSVRPSDAVVIIDESLLPSEYVIEKVVTTKSIDKAAIKKALKAGEEVAGADLEFRSNLQRR
jgi:hypothetical protein